MAEKLRIFPILSSQLQFSVSNPVFEPLAAQILGNAATDGDGFNADLLAVAQQLDSDAALVTAGDQDLADAGFTPGVFASANIDPLVQETGVFNSSGDGLLNQLGTDSQVPTSTAPTPSCGTQLTDADGYKQSACDVGTASFARHYGGWPMGDCMVAATTLIFSGEQTHAPTAIRVVSSGAAFKKLTLRTVIPGPPPGENAYIDATVDSSKAGHFDATVAVAWPDTRGTQLVKLCIDIVDSSTLQSNVQTALLPLER